MEVKTLIEYGSGTTMPPNIRKISNEGFKEKRRRYLTEDGVTIRDKEQLFHYEVYRVPHPSGKRGKKCSYCHFNVPENATYYRTCGAYPI